MSNYSVRKPISVLMGILITIVLGIFSITKLPLTLFPDINLPYIVTITTYEGASPDTVEREVTSKIEAAVQTIGNFEEVQSMSNEHFGVSIITFAQSTNMDAVIIELRELINNISFDEGVGNTRILRINPDMLPVVTVNLFRSYDEDLTDEEILIRNTEWINQDIIKELQSIPGVADIGVTGAADVVLQINLDNNLLANYNLDNNKVLSIIEEQNIGGLIGVALDNGEIRMLYLGNKIASLYDIKKLPITKKDDEVITLEQLTIENGIKYVNGNQENYSKINNQQGIQISFQMQTNYSITEVSNNIIERLDEIVAKEENASYKVLLNQGDYIELSIKSVLDNLIIGGILAIFILLLFLKDLKPTLIVGLSIPTSVIASFMLMYFANVSLNVVSMGGLALGIGMLVDNSIVVIENIYRLIGEGKSKIEAAIYGAKQVTAAIISSTLTTIAVFFPIIFIEGMIADVFMDMALTIAFSLGASLIIALTLVPSMASRMLNDKKQPKEGIIIRKTKEFYDKSITFGLKHKFLAIIVIVLIFAASSFAVISKGFIMFPETDEGTINISIDLSSNVKFKDKALYADKITEQLLELEDVDTVSASINSSSTMMLMSLMSSDDLSFTINLKTNRKKDTKDYEKIVSDIIDNFDYSQIEGITKDDILEKEVKAQNSVISILGSQGIVIKVAGPNLETLEKIANDITAILKENPDLKKIDDGISRGEDNIKITINKENAMSYGLTATDVNNSISYLYNTLSNVVTSQTVTLKIDNIEYDIDIPSSLVGSVEYGLFGDYMQFLSGIVLFDKDTQAMIDEYLEDNPTGIYVPNLMLPTYHGEPICFVVNPFLKVIDNQIVLDPFTPAPTLASLAVANLYDDSDKSVAEINYITGFSTISTDGNTYYLNVTADIVEGKNITLVGNKVTEAVEKYLDSEKFKGYGRGYEVSFVGENEEIMNAVNDLMIAGLVAILLVYMIMAIQFQSLIYPLIILITIPLAFTGGMIALLIANMQLSIVSIMGLIILVGVVVNNGIVLVDYINQLIAEGKTIKEAIIEAGKTRLRPIFMTAITTILGLTSMALGYGEGAELLQPLAVTVVGGLIYATIITLLIVPLIYAAFNHRKMKLEINNDNER